MKLPERSAVWYEECNMECNMDIYNTTNLSTRVFCICYTPNLKYTLITT